MSESPPPRINKMPAVWPREGQRWRMRWQLRARGRDREWAAHGKALWGRRGLPFSWTCPPSAQVQSHLAGQEPALRRPSSMAEQLSRPGAGGRGQGTGAGGQRAGAGAGGRWEESPPLPRQPPGSPGYPHCLKLTSRWPLQLAGGPHRWGVQGRRDGGAGRSGSLGGPQPPAAVGGGRSMKCSGDPPAASSTAPGGPLGPWQVWGVPAPCQMPALSL